MTFSPAHRVIPILTATLLALDLSFWSANVPKIPHGGWFPLVVGLAFFTFMTTWHRGAYLLAVLVARITPELQTFLGRVRSESIVRTPGAAVFVTGRLEQTPPALQQLLKHTGVLPQTVVILTVVVETEAKIPLEERIELKNLGDGFHRLVLRYGFMQGPNVPSDLAECAALGLKLDLNRVHYFIGQVDLFEGRRADGMSAWRDRLFMFMARNTPDATASYQIPAAQTMTVGLQVGI